MQNNFKIMSNFNKTIEWNQAQDIARQNQLDQEARLAQKKEDLEHFMLEHPETLTYSDLVFYSGKTGKTPAELYELHPDKEYFNIELLAQDADDDDFIFSILY